MRQSIKNLMTRENRLASLLVGLLMALVFATPGVALAVQSITYYHWDALGSPVAASDETGNLKWREQYQPYGERIQNQTVAQSNSRWYTGHPHDNATGLTYMGARWYDPAVGRFMAVDPKDFDEKNFHSFNRYKYANNNPYTYIDPDGMDEVSAEDEFANGTPGQQQLREIHTAGVKFSEIGEKTVEEAGWFGVGGVVGRGFGGLARFFGFGARVTISEARVGHIFRNAEGHLLDTPANRRLLSEVANSRSAQLGVDKWGNSWAARIREDGSQVWVQTRNREIINGGVNATPRTFNPETGLSRPTPP